MSIRQLASLVQPRLLELLAETPPKIPEGGGHPKSVLFFSVSTGSDQAVVEIATGTTFEAAWDAGLRALNRAFLEQKRRPIWMRVDAVVGLQHHTWGELRVILNEVKRNYYTRGITLDAAFKHAMLEQEIGANAVLYDNQFRGCVPNAGNMAAFGKRRFGTPLKWPTNDAESIWSFWTRGVFSDGKGVFTMEHEGRHSGYRRLDNWEPDYIKEVVRSSTHYLAEQVKPTGEYHYGWFPCFDRPIGTYNTLRHASSTYATLEGWELTKDPEHMRAIERSLRFLATRLIQQMIRPDGTRCAYLVDLGNEVKLGGNAVCLLAYVKYTEFTGDQQYLPLMEALANGIRSMQNPQTGKFTHVLLWPTLEVKSEFRIIYYDGEAAFGLMRLYGLTKDQRWLDTVVKAFEYFIANDHWKAHDHWLSYCVNELTLYRPEDRYYRFGLENVRDYLNFVIGRITTFPTLLELMMAAQRMIERIRADPERNHLLEGFKLAKFYRALETRARYLMNGFFFPELAMFYRNPPKVLGSFFIRHHAFRVRIDDVEHYLSGYVAYWKYRTKLAEGAGPQEALDGLRHVLGDRGRTPVSETSGEVGDGEDDGG